MKVDQQHTIAAGVRFEGVGLHTGNFVKIEVSPAPGNTGIVFVRKDVNDTAIKAVVDNAIKTGKFLRRTCIGTEAVHVQTIEHLMAAFSMLGVDNALVSVWGSEIPGMDGSAKAFVEAFLKVGIIEQDVLRRYIRVSEAIDINDNGTSIAVTPCDQLKITYTIDYANPVIGSCTREVVIDRSAASCVAHKYYEARTFCLEDEAKQLLSMGLGQGSNYDNTLVVSNTGVVNNSLRCDDEFVKHKMLDLIGDLYLLGPVTGHITAVKSGHAMTVRLIDAIHNQVYGKNTQEVRKMENNVAGNKILYIEDIMKIVPHRFPFLLVDRVIELEKGKRGVGIKNLTMNEHFFQGHFPGRPVMPGVLIMEALAQVACVTMFSCDEYKGKLAFFMAMNNVKFRKPVVPGDQLRLEIEVGKVRSKTGMVNAKALVDGAVVAEGELMFAFVD